jgi:hypothetical protein
MSRLGRLLALAALAIKKCAGYDVCSVGENGQPLALLRTHSGRRACLRIVPERAGAGRSRRVEKGSGGDPPPLGGPSFAQEVVLDLAGRRAWDITLVYERD